MALEHISLEQWYAAWPPDDTEESIMGSDWHQLSIRNLCLGINEIARDEAGPGKPLAFQAVSQTTLLGLLRRGKTDIKAMPDVYIFKKPVDGRRLSYSVRHDGPPAVAIEVASDSTFDKDIDFEAGKGWIYAAAGIAEYLTIDTSGYLQDPALQAWRLRNEVYAACALDAGGIWWSEEVPIGVAVRDGMTVVYDRAHQAQLREGEVRAALQRQEASGRTQGLAQGLTQGRRQALLRILQRRFGTLPESVLAAIACLEDPEVLDALIDAAVDARSPAEFARQMP